MGMARNETKRQSKRKSLQCKEHNFTDDDFRDPADRRRILRNKIVKLDNNKYTLRHCETCGIGELTRL